MRTITALYEKFPLSAKACHSLQCLHSKGRMITTWESSWFMTSNTQELLVLHQEWWEKKWNCLLPWVCKRFALCDRQCSGSTAGSLHLPGPIRYCLIGTLWLRKAKQHTWPYSMWAPTWEHCQPLISVFAWQPQTNSFGLNLSLSLYVRLTCSSHRCLSKVGLYTILKLGEWEGWGGHGE